MVSPTVIFCWTLIVLSSCVVEHNADSGRKLLVLSFDAFKPVYLEKGITPNFQKFYSKGVKATSMTNQFPTKTFVNHYSIATGLYPQNHGVTGNEVYDRVWGFYKYSYPLFHYNQSVTPIWSWVLENRKKASCMMWPGSDYQFRGYQCYPHEPLEPKMDFNTRVQKVMEWFQNGSDFVMFYYEQPDDDGHAYSPDSQQEIKMVEKINEFVDDLETALKKYNLYDKTDVIILSDHGMLTVNPMNFIDLFAFADYSDCTCYGSSPVVQMICKNKQTEACSNLTNAADILGTFKVYTDDQLPERWHVRNSQRFGPCTCVAEPEYAFQDMWGLAEWFRDVRGVPITMDSAYGVHGYDNTVDSMRPIFMARGPSFKTGVTIDDQFANIDLFHLFCRLLGIPSISIDGQNRSDVWDKMLN